MYNLNTSEVALLSFVVQHIQPTQVFYFHMNEGKSVITH